MHATIRCVFLTMCGLSWAFPRVTIAHEGASVVGAEIKYAHPSAATGILYGWRYTYQPSESFSIGGAGFTGQLSGTATGSFSYGGLVAAHNQRLSQIAGLELSLLAGGGGGFLSNGTQIGGIVLEPTAAFNIALGPRVRTSLGAGYTWLPTSTPFSGLNVGLRFEFIADDGTAAAAAPADASAHAPAGH